MNVEHLNVVVACRQAGLQTAGSTELPVSARGVPDDLLDAVYRPWKGKPVVMTCQVATLLELCFDLGDEHI